MGVGSLTVRPLRGLVLLPLGKVAHDVHLPVVISVQPEVVGPVVDRHHLLGSVVADQGRRVDKRSCGFRSGFISVIWLARERYLLGTFST